MLGHFRSSKSDYQYPKVVSSILALALAKFYALPFMALNQIWKLSVTKSALPMHWLCFGNSTFPTKTICVGKLTAVIWPNKHDLPGWNVNLTALIWPTEPGVPSWNVDLTALIWPTEPGVSGWNVDLTALIWPTAPGVPGWNVDLSVYKFLSLWVGRWFHTEWCDDCMHGVSVILFTAVTALSSVAFNLPPSYFAINFFISLKIKFCFYLYIVIVLKWTTLKTAYLLILIDILP